MKRRWGVALLVGLAALACGREASELSIAAPAQPRAALVLEPPVVALGDVADIVLAVVTQPEWSVRPTPPPADLRGFAWIEREPLPVAREPARWVHRTRLRVRALEIGRFDFPAGRVQVVSPEGETSTLAYDVLPLEVVSGLGDAPTRRTPYGVRLLPRSRASRGALVAAFTAGAGLALAGVGLVLLARRRLAAPVADLPPPPADPPWQWARDELGRARDLLDRDPRAALDAAACTLRRYVVRRYGGDANVRTTPELRDAKPPFAMTTRWPRFVELLAGLDATRFSRPSEAGGGDEEATRLFEAVVAFVEEMTPVEHR